MWKYSKIISHRGGGILAPENTLSAMKIGPFYGVHAVEFDVMLTKDLVPIIMHDDVLGRTIEGVGNISDYTFEELAQKDAGKWWSDRVAVLKKTFEESKLKEIIVESRKIDQELIDEISKHGFTYENELVPTFESVANYCISNNIWMNIEIKPAPGFEELTGITVAKVTESLFSAELSKESPDVTRLPLFSSFSFESLKAALQIAPKIPRGFLYEDIPVNWHDQLLELQASHLHCDEEKLTQELTQQIKQQGYGVMCYTVNNVQRANELFAWGVDSICTDRVDLMSKLQ